MSTLKSLTKAELIALLQERNASIEALRLEVSTLKGTLALLPQPKPATTARLNYLAHRAAREAAGPTPFQLACAAARAAAMASGKVVQVAV